MLLGQRKYAVSRTLRLASTPGESWTELRKMTFALSYACSDDAF